MHVVWHEDELVHFKAFLKPTLTENIREEFAKTIRLQKELAFCGGERYEEGSNLLRC